jgi:hypothetical protein
MDPVNRLDQIMRLIGQQMSERAARLEAGGKSLPAASPTRLARRPSLTALKSKVQERLNALDPDDPRHPEKSRRVFLESVLAWQFGNELMLDRGFAEIVAGVQEALRAHPRADARLGELLRDLITTPRRTAPAPRNPRE